MTFSVSHRFPILLSAVSSSTVVVANLIFPDTADTTQPRTAQWSHEDCGMVGFRIKPSLVSSGGTRRKQTDSKWRLSRRPTSTMQRIRRRHSENEKCNNNSVQRVSFVSGLSWETTVHKTSPLWNWLWLIESSLSFCWVVPSPNVMPLEIAHPLMR